MNRRLIALLLFPAFAPVFPASGQAPPAGPLTLRRAAERALARAPEASSARAQAAEADADARAAAATFGPRAFATTTPGYSSGLPVEVAGRVPSVFGVEVHQTLYDPARAPRRSRRGSRGGLEPPPPDPAPRPRAPSSFPTAATGRTAGKSKTPGGTSKRARRSSGASRRSPAKGAGRISMRNAPGSKSRAPSRRSPTAKRSGTSTVSSSRGSPIPRAANRSRPRKTRSPPSPSLPRAITWRPLGAPTRSSPPSTGRSPRSKPRPGFRSAPGFRPSRPRGGTCASPTTTTSTSTSSSSRPTTGPSGSPWLSRSGRAGVSNTARPPRTRVSRRSARTAADANGISSSPSGAPRRTSPAPGRISSSLREPSPRRGKACASRNRSPPRGAATPTAWTSPRSPSRRPRTKHPRRPRASSPRGRGCSSCAGSCPPRCSASNRQTGNRKGERRKEQNSASEREGCRRTDLRFADARGGDGGRGRRRGLQFWPRAGSRRVVAARPSGDGGRHRRPQRRRQDNSHRRDLRPDPSRPGDRARAGAGRDGQRLGRSRSDRRASSGNRPLRRGDALAEPSFCGGALRDPPSGRSHHRGPGTGGPQLAEERRRARILRGDEAPPGDRPRPAPRPAAAHPRRADGGCRRRSPASDLGPRAVAPGRRSDVRPDHELSRRGHGAVRSRRHSACGQAHCRGHAGGARGADRDVWSWSAGGEGAARINERLRGTEACCGPRSSISACASISPWTSVPKTSCARRARSAPSRDSARALPTLSRCSAP